MPVYRVYFVILNLRNYPICRCVRGNSGKCGCEGYEFHEIVFCGVMILKYCEVLDVGILFVKKS